MLENSEDSIDLYLSSDDSSVDLNRKPKKMIKKNVTETFLKRIF